MNFPHNEIKINSVLLMMSLKLTIKVVAFFLGHPVYPGLFWRLSSPGGGGGGVLIYANNLIFTINH